MASNQEQEGVIKFRLIFDDRPLQLQASILEPLNRFRSELIKARLIGEDPERYDGYGFGNISIRLPEHAHHYLITGTQTGKLPALILEDCACIIASDTNQNTLHAYGNTRPSSESMTHAALYESNEKLNCVVHVHSPEIWQFSDALELPSTAAEIPYGTVAMAEAVQELACQHRHQPGSFVFAMKGHQDGIVATGADIESCTRALLELQQKAIKMDESEHSSNHQHS